MNRTCVIFGGCGFIGSHYAQHLLDRKLFDTIVLADIAPAGPLHNIEGKTIKYMKVDVRKSSDFYALPNDVIFIANFAAVHREPGHEDWEYYETNLLGAENICSWAELVRCRHILFTSSIAPYGRAEVEKDETALPVPISAYGCSKLVAEKIHLCWQNSEASDRFLTITRPGVVFGPGEGGNVSRLVRAVLKRYFLYMGNKNTRKAGVYVKELCHAMSWVVENQLASGERTALFNMSMSPSPSIQDYVRAACATAGVSRFVPSIPYTVLLALAFMLDAIARPLRIKHPFSPVRIKKLVRSNNIIPSYLVQRKYPYRYTLETAFLDWKQSAPSEWS